MSERSAIKNFDLTTYETLVAYNGDILFEWDLVTDRFYTTSNLFDIFGYMPSSYNFTKTLDDSVNIHPADKGLLKDYLETIQFTPHNLKNGKYYANLEIRIRNIYHEYIWCRIRLIAAYSEQNMPYKISGMISSIDFDKTHQRAVLTQAQKDPLTGLYNKSATCALAKSWLSAPGKYTGAFILIGLDDFQAIGDHFGALFGDAILADTATAIQENFLATDIVGRIGGDEFAVFIKDVYSLADLKKKLKTLNIKLTRAYQSKETTCKISASIGVALFPAHGKDFDTLFAHADQAFCYVKQHGKNDAMLYREKLPISLPPAKSPVGGAAAPQKSFDENLLEYIFKLLYNAKDSQATIHLLLEVLGRKLKVSRSFIYQRSADGRYYEKAFEWYDLGIAPLEQPFQSVRSIEIDAAYQRFGQENSLICNDVQKLPPDQIDYFKRANTKAFLQIRLMEGTASRGYIGFEECARSREWNAHEINIITFLANVFTAFLQRDELQAQSEQSQNTLLHILQTLDTALYVVDPRTYHIIFRSHKMELFCVESADSTQKCYELFHQLDQPCANCPLQAVTAQRPSAALEMYDEQREISVKKTFSKLDWNGRPDCRLVQVETTARCGEPEPAPPSK